MNDTSNNLPYLYLHPLDRQMVAALYDLRRYRVVEDARIQSGFIYTTIHNLDADLAAMNMRRSSSVGRARPS